MNDTLRTRISTPVLAALAATSLTATLGISIASVVLPTLTQAFSASIFDVQWIVLIYLTAMTIAVVPAGRWGDLFGHRRVLIGGLLVFIAASVLCATALDLTVLVIGRGLQGLGGAVLVALPISMARELVPSERLGAAMGLLGTTSAFGTALGPSMGGALLTLGDWRLLFWLLGAFGAGALLLAIWVFPRRPHQEHASLKQLDLFGTSALVVTLAAYAFVTSGGAVGLPFSPMLLIAVVLAGITVFVIVEKCATWPLLPMALLSERSTCIGFLMNILIGIVMMSTLVVGPYFLAFSLGLSEFFIGVVLAVGPAVAAFSGIPAGRLTDLLGADRVLRIGLIQTTGGLLCLAFLPRFFGVAGYVVALVVLTPAFQLFLAANNTAVMADADKDQRGRLSGLLGLSRNLGLMTGAAVMPVVFVRFLGGRDDLTAASIDVARSFSMTFVIAAFLALLALGLSYQIRKPIAQRVWRGQRKGQ